MPDNSGNSERSKIDPKNLPPPLKYLVVAWQQRKRHPIISIAVLVIVLSPVVYWLAMQFAGPCKPATGAWMSTGEYHAVYNSVRNYCYPTIVQGRFKNGVDEFRADWKPHPTAGFAFHTYRGMTMTAFNNRNASLQAQGFSLESQQQFIGLAGVTQVQATWVKR